MNDINYILCKLSKSKFRSSFHLKENDIKYLKEKGYLKIKEHAYDFIEKRLSSKQIVNDGRQTPMRGHPVFIAQHATATCCRSCLEKWHHIPANKELSRKEVDYIASVILEWIIREYKNNN